MALNPIPLWPAFFPSAPVVPKLYYDALSPEQRIKKLCEELHRLCEYANMLGIRVNEDSAIVEKLAAEFDKFIEGGFEEYYEGMLSAWILQNAGELLTKYIKLVFFGLTPDGYFCAWIPETWDEITFDTVADYSDPLYGRLVLLYDAEGNFELNYGTGDGVTVADYETLSNKPSINGVTLIGNNTFEQLGLHPVTSNDIHEIVGGG